MLLRIAEDFQRMSGLPIMEPAAWELAATNHRRRAAPLRRSGSGAGRGVPVFPAARPALSKKNSPPSLAAEAAANHRAFAFWSPSRLAGNPMLDAMRARILQCLNKIAPVGE